MFRAWVSGSKWLDHVVANYLDDFVRDLTGYELDGENIEDIGYVQVFQLSYEWHCRVFEDFIRRSWACRNDQLLFVFLSAGS